MIDAAKPKEPTRMKAPPGKWWLIGTDERSRTEAIILDADIGQRALTEQRARLHNQGDK